MGWRVGRMGKKVVTYLVPLLVSSREKPFTIYNSQSYQLPFPSYIPICPFPAYSRHFSQSSLLSNF